MKIKYGLLLAAVVLIGGLALQAAIEWRVNNALVITEVLNHTGASRIELGLRDDGIVVWRKITNTTNSPAENFIILTNVTWSTNAIWMDLSKPTTYSVEE